MNPLATVSQPTPRAAPLPMGKLTAIVILLLTALASGCSNIRLPAIDSSGQCIFAPPGTTTTFALPGSGGEDTICSRTLGQLKRGLQEHKERFHGRRDQFADVFPPTPAFPEPVPPPPCQAPSIIAGAAGEPCVPSVPCNGSCKNGPPAVLYGCEIDAKKTKLPRKGKRGCILLSPQKIVAPVGGEVVLLSGICGTDGYLQMNERLEWMLTPDSVGTFIQVGDDAPGLLTRLAGAKKEPKKHDASYAHGLTSRKRMLITRGNNDPRDDVSLEKGQTWISISSPSEGTSHVTVLAPDSECWDQRKATATIHWIDARWQFPGPQLVPAGQPVSLTTRVTRADGSTSASGWRVRYEILQPGLATFAGTDSSSVVEAVVDSSGNATVELIPVQGTSGTATIDMQILWPLGQSGNLPAIGRGQTFVTWSSPQLALRAGAPQVATFDVPVQVVANVSNPGDQAATNVRVEVPIPAGARVTEADSFAQVLPGAVVWEIGTIPPQQQLDLFMSVATQAPIQLPFVAIGDGLRAEDTVRIDVFRPSLSLAVQPQRERYESGQPVTFNIDVTNTGDRPLQDVVLTARGDDGMEHQEGGRGIRNDRGAPLQPGETWAKSVTFVPTNSGQRCITVEATAAGGQVTSQQSCVTVINPAPPAQSLSAILEGPNQITIGAAPSIVAATITNNGEVTLRDIRVSMVNDPQLQLLQATEENRDRASTNLVVWTVPSLAPGDSILLEGEYQGTAVNPSARVGLRAESVEGVSTETDFICNIVAAAPSGGGLPAPPLPPTTTPPTIPGGPGTSPAPLQGPPGDVVAPPVRSQRLQADLFVRDNPVRVNDTIRYSLTIVNDSDQRDGQVLIQFQLPAGVTLRRANPRTNPELGEYQNNAGLISLPLIRSMEPGESIDYQIELISNQPQTFNLDVLIRSLREQAGITVTAQTDVQ